MERRWRCLAESLGTPSQHARVDTRRYKSYKSSRHDGCGPSVQEQHATSERLTATRSPGTFRRATAQLTSLAAGRRYATTQPHPTQVTCTRGQSQQPAQAYPTPTQIVKLINPGACSTKGVIVEYSVRCKIIGSGSRARVIGLVRLAAT